jgi:trimethylamine corrinoid protein
LEQGLDPLVVINEGFVPGIEYVGDQFGAGEMYLPDLMLAAEAMKDAVGILEPEMKRRGLQRQMLGKVVRVTLTPINIQIDQRRFTSPFAANLYPQLFGELW